MALKSSLGASEATMGDAASGAGSEGGGVEGRTLTSAISTGGAARSGESRCRRGHGGWHCRDLQRRFGCHSGRDRGLGGTRCRFRFCFQRHLNWPWRLLGLGDQDGRGLTRLDGGGLAHHARQDITHVRVACARGLAAKDGGNHVLAVALHGGDEVEPGCARVAGLDAFGAGIVEQQRVVIAVDLPRYVKYLSEKRR